MKVLIGIATYPPESGNPPIYPATQAALDALAFDGEMEIRHYGGDDPKLASQDNLAAKHNQMRADVLDGDYDALLTIEADMIVPPDALTKLAALDVDIAYALYCSRSSGMWLCFPELSDGPTKALNAHAPSARKAWGTVLPSEGAGFGCTLIQRRVLEAITFRVDNRRKRHDDWLFALDAKAAGFKSAHDLSVVCGHIIHDGGVMWPDPESPNLRRIDGRETPQFRGVVLPSSATYRTIRLVGDHPIGSKIVLTADAAAILFARHAIKNIEENEK